MLSPLLAWVKGRLRVRQLLPQGSCFLVRFRRHNDFDDGIEIASVLLLANPFLDTQPLTSPLPGNGQQNTLFKRWHRHLSAERRLPWGKRKDDFQILIDNIKERMRGNMDNEP